MNDAQFWSLIDSTRRGAEDDPDAHIEALTAALAELSESEIVDFDRCFTEHWIRAYTWDLWAAAYIIGGGCSDDGFTDFRGWLISRGREVYEQALAEPQSLAAVVRDEDECQIQGYDHAPRLAWSRKTGKDYLEFPESWTGRYPREPPGERWTDEDLPRRFPKLWANSGEPIGCNCRGPSSGARAIGVGFPPPTSRRFRLSASKAGGLSNEAMQRPLSARR